MSKLNSNYSTHHRALGDVAGTNRFENLALSTKHDLNIIKLAHRKGSNVPKFRFEQKSFNVVKCNTDLAETELEIQVVRGISYNVSKPKDVDTYVKVEFPYPQVRQINFNIALAHILNVHSFNSKYRKHRIETKPPSFMTLRVPNTMRNLWPKFNRKHVYANAFLSVTVLNLKFISKGRWA